MNGVGWDGEGYRRGVEAVGGRARVIAGNDLAAIDRALGEARAATGVPTVVIAGALDQTTPPERGREIHAAIAGSEFVVLPDVAHLSNAEAEAAFDRAVTRFLVGS